MDNKVEYFNAGMRNSFPITEETKALMEIIKAGPSEVYIPTSWILSQLDPKATMEKLFATDKWEACAYINGFCPKTIHAQAFPTVVPEDCRYDYLYNLKVYHGIE